jgi:branched-chain amino acid transport system substrate-binding protein
MVKLALLIGTSQYGPGFNQLPAATKDVEAMQRVLLHPDMGDFDQVQPLLDPDPQEMGTAIENLFGGGSRDDLLLLFFSGHGVKDESGNLL